MVLRRHLDALAGFTLIAAPCGARLVLALAALASLMVFQPSAARACTLIAPVSLLRTDEERATYEKQAAKAERAAARARRSAFRRAVRAGEVDSALGLANLLIPNVREWYEDHGSCGPDGDGDGPRMPVQGVLEEAFAGSELEGLSGSELSDLAVRFRRDALPGYNHDCSAEFRARFADRLRASIPQRRLDDSLLLLSEQGERRWSTYFRFADVKRATRPQARPSSRQLAKVLSSRRHPVGRAIEDFWMAETARLGSPALVCPAAYRQLVADRDAELRRLRQRPGYAQQLEQAARAREHR